MSVKNFNIVSVGVGGQGVISATEILAHAAMLDDNNVRTAETHGMAQRGGSVSGYLRFGKDVEGPLIPKGGADILISLEPIEALRNRLYANKETSIFINQNRIPPLSLYQNRKLRYPKLEEIKEDLKKISPQVHYVDANKLATEAGNVKAINVIMIGVMFGSGKLPISADSLRAAVFKFVPPKAREINEKAFKLGSEVGKKIKEGN